MRTFIRRLLSDLRPTRQPELMSSTAVTSKCKTGLLSGADRATDRLSLSETAQTPQGKLRAVTTLAGTSH